MKKAILLASLMFSLTSFARSGGESGWGGNHEQHGVLKELLAFMSMEEIVYWCSDYDGLNSACLEGLLRQKLENPPESSQSGEWKLWED